MTDCVNTYLIDRHLQEQEDREAHEMRYVEMIDAYQCQSCNWLHKSESDAKGCCGDVAASISDAYICTVCERISEDLDDIRGHDHD